MFSLLLTKHPIPAESCWPQNSRCGAEYSAMAAGQIAHRENCGSGQFGHAGQLRGSSYSEQAVMRVGVVRLCFEGARLQPRRNCRQVEGTVTKDEAWSLANHWVAAWNTPHIDLF